MHILIKFTISCVICAAVGTSDNNNNNSCLHNQEKEEQQPANQTSDNADGYLTEQATNAVSDTEGDNI